MEVLNKGSQWEVAAVINKVSRSFMINGDTDWFDDTFIKNINGLLRDSGSSYTFYSVQDEMWGQEMGFIYIHDSLAESICALLSQPGREQFWGSIDNGVDRSSL